MRAITVVFLVLGAALTAGLSQKPYYNVDDQEECWRLFESFIIKYNKQYLSEAEKNHRFTIFVQNLEKINEYNRKSETSVHRIYKHADLTIEEFRTRRTGFIDQPHNLSKDPTDLSDLTLEGVPDSFDWRDKGVVSRVKDQRHCGSCWAFSVIGNIESQYAMKHNKIVEFSEQQLVSCDRLDHHCCGGSLDKPFEAIREWGGGLKSEQDYPYNADKLTYSTEQICIKHPSKDAVNVTDYHIYDLTDISEDQIKALLYKNGPISLSIFANGIISHWEGIYKNCEERGENNHAVLLVGYGVENDVPYWTFKNSWGEEYHDKGYFKVLRGQNCLNMKNFHAVSAVVE